jgi:hypothetical protein
MASIILPSRWTKQPQGAVEIINRYDAADFWLPGKNKVTSGSPAYGGTGQGSSVILDGSNRNYIQLKKLPLNYTYLFVGRLRSNFSYNQAVHDGRNGGLLSSYGNGSLFVQAHQDTGQLAMAYVYTSPFVIAVSASPNTTNGHKVAVKIAGGAVVTGEATTADYTSWYNTYYVPESSGVRIGGLATSDIECAGLVILNGSRPLVELVDLANNPWQIFKKKKQVIYSFSSGITVQTLFAVTYPSGTGTPSNVQIVAGQDSTGSAASWSGNAVWTGSGQYLDASGLDPATEYNSAAVIYDGTTYSNVVEVSGTWTTLSLRYGRPTSDLSAGSWTPSIGSDLYAMLDEETASDAPDYITTSTAYDPCELALSAVTDPATSSGQVITIRAKSSVGSTLVATLKQPGGISGGLFLPRRWTKQPQGAVEVDRGNMFGRHVICGFVGNVPVNNTTQPTNLVPIIGASGKILSVSTYNQPGIGMNISRPGVPIKSFIMRNSTTDLSSMYPMLMLTGEANSFIFSTDSYLVVRKSGVDSYSPIAFFNNYEGQHQSAVSCDSGAVNFYKSYQLLAPAGGLSNFGVTGETVSFLGNNSTSRCTTVEYILAFDVNLKDSGLSAYLGSLDRNPWQIFKPKKQVIYSFGTPSAIATRTFSSLGSSFADYQINLTPTECDSITDYSNLSISLEAQ